MYEREFTDAEEYQTYLAQKNVGYSVETFMMSRLEGETEMTLRCTFTKRLVKLPIRHSNFYKVNCLFDMESWMEYFKMKLAANESQSFNCPGCKQYTYFNEYGVDFQLLGIMAQKDKLSRNGAKIVEDKIVFKNLNGVPDFRAILLSDRKTTIPIVGVHPILTSKKNQNKIITGQTQQKHQYLIDELDQTFSQLQQFIIQKKLKALKQNKFSQQQLNNKFKQILPQMKNIISKNIKLISIGSKSLNLNFTFGFKKIFRDQNVIGSVLVVFYPYLGIWLDFEFQSQILFQLDYALYLKDESFENENIIYVIGGKTEQFVQSNQFIKITFPKDPFTKQTYANVQKLKELPVDGYNFFGGIYEGKVYVFNGQRKFVRNNLITDEILNNVYVYQNNSWRNLNITLKQRFDGSYFKINHKTYGPCLLMYGGTARVPDGQIGYVNPKQQNIVEIFQFKTQQLLGDGFPLIYSQDPYDDYQKSMLSAPSFSIPYGNHSELIIDGEFLKFKWKEQRQIFILDWATGDFKLNQVQSTQPHTQCLTIQQARTYSGLEYFTPIQDIDGVIAFGKYYTIHQIEIKKEGQQQSSSTIQLFVYNITNGQSNVKAYQSREDSQKECQIVLGRLPNRENQYI